MTKVERRLSISIMAVQLLVCASTAIVCMHGLSMWVVIATSLIVNAALSFVIHMSGEPDSFMIVFLSSGMTATALSGASAGLLYVFTPFIGVITDSVYPEQERGYVTISTKILLCFSALLWMIRFLLPIRVDNEICAELFGAVGAIITYTLMAHVGAYKRELLRFQIKRSSEIAEHDPMTGLNNRKSFDRFIIEQANKIETFSLIMMDIDNFKKVNDTYGHVEGDAILKDLASVIQCHIRSSDCGFRYGGEEFAIVCPKTDAKGAGILAERVRVAFSSKVHYYDDFENPELRQRQFTVSLGVAESRIGEFKDVKDLVARCDSALYEAKHNGKNQVRFYKPKDEGTPKLGIGQ